VHPSKVSGVRMGPRAVYGLAIIMIATNLKGIQPGGIAGKAVPPAGCPAVPKPHANFCAGAILPFEKRDRIQGKAPISCFQAAALKWLETHLRVSQRYPPYTGLTFADAIQRLSDGLCTVYIDR
jgi:hypothetical protein